MFTPHRQNGSLFEDLLNRSSNIIPMALRYHHPNFSHTLPSELLLEYLAPQALHQLRLVSRATATWANQALGSAFNTIYINKGRYANHTIETERSLRALQRIGGHCQHLVVRLQHLPASTVKTQPHLQDSSSPPSQPKPSHHRSASTSATSPLAGNKPSHRFHWPKHTPFRHRSGSGSIHHNLRSPPPPTSAPRLPPPPPPPPLTQPVSPPASIPQFPTTTSAPPFKLILSHLPHLSTLTLSVPTPTPSSSTTTTTTTTAKTTTWAPSLLNSPEAQLISLRIALEESPLPDFTKLTLHPIHLMGILHLRWAGGGSWREASWMAGRTWMRVRQMDVRLEAPCGGLCNYYHHDERRRVEEEGEGGGGGGGGGGGAGGLTKDRGRMFVKVLHDYLASFRLRLERLRFWWVVTSDDGDDDDDASFSPRGVGGGKNPNPLLLDLDDSASKGRKGFSAPAIEWKVLGECWLGNVRVDARAVELIWQRARRLRVLRVMDEFWDGDVGVGDLVCVEGVWWREFRGEEEQVVGHSSENDHLVEEQIDGELRVGDSAGVSDDENIWGEGWDEGNGLADEGDVYDDFDDETFSQTSMVVPFMLQR
ncbi:MAG: hypothetical protein M1836_000278 [Candelina mexicana]|nr:MAG: hypothetical protein M1836_000278 [Candelina mexicana]